MHRSRIGVVLIDHPTDMYDSAAAFWRGATGHDLAPDGGSGGGHDDPYEPIGTLGRAVKLELQRTGRGTPARVHLDIETDDVEAETARLIRLGATGVEERQGYRIMADPGGMAFCVVPVQTDEFDEHAVSWSS